MTRTTLAEKKRALALIRKSDSGVNGIANARLSVDASCEYNGASLIARSGRTAEHRASSLLSAVKLIADGN